MNVQILLQATLCTIIVAIFALTTHIYVMKWLQPYINRVMELAILHNIDKWLANVLLALCLVYLCPKKVSQKKGS